MRHILGISGRMDLPCISALFTGVNRVQKQLYFRVSFSSHLLLPVVARLSLATFQTGIITWISTYDKRNCESE